MDIINILCMATSIILFAVTCFVVKPLTTSIESLQTAINKLDDVVEILRNSATMNKVEIAKTDESVKSAHKRIDDLSNHIHEMETRCINCSKK